MCDFLRFLLSTDLGSLFVSFGPIVLFIIFYILFFNKFFVSIEDEIKYSSFDKWIRKWIGLIFWTIVFSICYFLFGLGTEFGCTNLFE